LNRKNFFTIHKEQLLTISTLFAISLISFGTFSSTIISSDDWSYFISKYAFSELRPVNLTDRRPLILVLYYGMASLFGLRVEYYYIINFIILFLSAILVYGLAKRVFPNSGWLPSQVSFAYLIYPVDYTRTWIIMIYIRFWWLVSLGVIWLLLEFVETGKKWTYLLAMLGIIIPLGAYEGQLGIILLASILITIFYKNNPAKRRFTIFGSVIAISLGFLCWRIYIQPLFLQISDSYVETLLFNPIVLAERYLRGFDIILRGWFDPINAQLKFLGINIINWFMFYVFICCLGIFWNKSNTVSKTAFKNLQKFTMAKSYIVIFFTGGALWVAGYIPIIMLYSPSLYGNASRVNFFAIAGASIMLVSTISIIATLLTRSPQQLRIVTTVIVLPFVVMGVFAQLQVNKERQITWEAQKQIWNGVFKTIPNLLDQRRLVIIIPGYQQLRPFESYPFISVWEIEAGIQVLYNNPSVSGNYFYKDIQSNNLQFTRNGFKPLPNDKIIPYKKLIFVYYDPISHSVKIVENLEEMLSLSFAVDNYNPYENLAPDKPSTAKFRWLVQ